MQARSRPTRGESPLRGAWGVLRLFVLGLPLAFICKGAEKPAPSAQLLAVQSYARACLAAIRLDPAKDLIGPFECQGPKAQRLELRVDGRRMDIGVCSGAGCPKEGDPPLAKCDYPTWLDDKCYGNSYVQELPTSNPKVKAVLLCRHKHNLSNKPDTFGDIALIAHNFGNGETCWFQAEKSERLPGGGSEGRLAGNGKVHGPLSPQVANDFWFHPNDAMEVYCIKCHDDGPFMNSRWMRNTIELEDTSSTPYKNSTPPFDHWPTPTFIELDKAKDELADNLDTCTFCHKIAAGLLKVDPDPTALGGPDFNTCKTWIGRATGVAHGRATPAGKNDLVTHWMPELSDGRTPYDPARPAEPIGHEKSEWDRAYGKHVQKILECCRAMGKRKSDPPQPATLPDGCREMKPKAGCPVEEVNGACPP